MKIDQEVKTSEIEKMSDKQLDSWVNHIQILLIINKFCYFLTSKLKNFQRSHVIAVSSLLSVIFTLFLTITVFGLQNYSLQKIDVNSFSDSSKGTLPFFFYYSFNTIFTNSISDFYPTSSWARLFNMLEIFFGFLIVVIFASVMINIQRDKHREGIESVIVSINNQGKDLEKFMQKEFSITTDQAITELEKLQGSLLKVINYFVSKIEPSE